MTLNPFAVIFWILAGLVGYIVSDSGRGVAIAIASAMVISILISLRSKN